MLDIITLGEAMIRFSPLNYERIEFATQLNFKVGGSEANVAVALTRLGIKAGWISKLTNNPLGRKIEAELRRWNVNLDALVWTSQYRIGTYYAEFGSDPRPTIILYDRTDSAFSHINVDDINWDYLKSCKIFHTSGITTALSNNCMNVVKECFKFMRDHNKLNSFDLNYRSKLWTPDQAHKILSNHILPYTDIFLSSEQDINLLFNFNGTLQEKASELLDKFNFKVIVLTRGPNPPYILQADGTEIYGTGYRPNLVDRIGAGDAFDAGFLYGYLIADIERGLKYAEAMSAIKFSIPGDMLIATREEIEAFIRKEDQLIKR
ncbi:MAG: PfkB family carbohydrate kinase [Candidatus Helarchaeota archaeon]